MSLRASICLNDEQMPYLFFEKELDMEDTKNLIRIANKIKDITRLKAGRYLELMRQLTILTGQLQETASESKKMGAA